MEMFVDVFNWSKQFSKWEIIRISVIGSVSKSALSFNSQPGMPSGPCALVVLSVDSFWRTDNSDATGTRRVVQLWNATIPKGIVAKRLKTLGGS